MFFCTFIIIIISEMDKARYFEFVYRLPENNRIQQKYKEDVYDRQVLLNEEWTDFAARCGRSREEAAEEHVKWITETWEDYMKRKVIQKIFLEENEDASQVQCRISEKRKEREIEKSCLVIDHLMNYQDKIDKTRIRSTHNLYVDFYGAQQIRFKAKREFVESHENLLRLKLRETENFLFLSLKTAARNSLLIKKLVFAERKAAEKAEQQRIEEEMKRAAEEQRRMEEQRKYEEEEAAKQRREQAEIEKRLERKRKEEQRRAKSRADRQRQQYPHSKNSDPAVTLSRESM